MHNLHMQCNNVHYFKTSQRITKRTHAKRAPRHETSQVTKRPQSRHVLSFTKRPEDKKSQKVPCYMLLKHILKLLQKTLKSIKKEGSTNYLPFSTSHYSPIVQY